MFRAELEMFAESCRSGKPNELTAHNGNVALAVVYAGLRSIERKAKRSKIADMIAEAHKTLRRRKHAMLPSRYFSDLTQPEIAAQLKKNPLVILPCGSVEQHGPHLPTGTDMLRRQRDRPRGRRAHGRPGAAGDAVRRHADAHAVRGHDHAARPTPTCGW